MTHNSKAVLISVFLAPGAIMAIEEPKFTVESRTAQYEIRKYASMLVAETTIDAGFDKAGNQGFRILADYIFGNNRSKTKIAMTAPVTQQAPSEKVAMTAPVSQIQVSGGFLVQFTMPASFTLASLPEPIDARVHLREVPPRRVAVKVYSGTWSEAHYQQQLIVFLAALKNDGVQTTGKPVFARFNSPFQLWFLRRNEIWIELAS